MKSRSLVIETLKNRPKNRLENHPDIKAAVAYVYCDYQDQNQEPQKLIAAIARQLLAVSDMIPEGVMIYDKLRKNGQPIPLDDTMKILRHACAAFDRVYICVDALDELQGRDIFLQCLKSLQEIFFSIHLFITGRNNVQNTVRAHLDQSMILQIEPNESDIRSLIKNKIDINRQHDPDLIDAELEHDITEKIVSQSIGKLVSPTLALRSYRLITS